MIIKSKGRKGSQRHFTTLYNYLCRKAEENFTYFHNFSHSQTQSAQDIINTFKANSKYIKKSKHLNVLYHEIISLKRQKGCEIEYYKHILNDLAQQFLEKRAPDQLAFAKIHADKDHSIHLHIMISSNGLQSTKRVRFNKFEFQKIQKEVEQYGRERYPDVIKELIYTRKGYAKDFDPVKKKKQREIKFQYNKRKQLELKTFEQLKNILKDIFQTAKTNEELQKALKNSDITLKQHGKNITAIYQSEDVKLRRRLKKLGLEKSYKQCQEKIAQYEKNMGDIKKIRDYHKKIDKEYEQDFEMWSQQHNENPFEFSFE